MSNKTVPMSDEMANLIRKVGDAKSELSDVRDTFQYFMSRELRAWPAWYWVVNACFLEAQRLAASELQSRC